MPPLPLLDRQGRAIQLVEDRRDMVLSRRSLRTHGGMYECMIPLGVPAVFRAALPLDPGAPQSRRGVPKEGLEPPRREAVAFEATTSAIPPLGLVRGLPPPRVSARTPRLPRACTGPLADPNHLSTPWKGLRVPCRRSSAQTRTHTWTPASSTGCCLSNTPWCTTAMDTRGASQGAPATVVPLSRRPAKPSYLGGSRLGPVAETGFEPAISWL